MQPGLSVMLSFLGSLLVGVTTGLLTAWLTARRFRGEQWWTRKAESYTSILVTLHEMKRFLKISFEDQIGNEAQSKERLGELRANCHHLILHHRATAF